ncbi:uncharacterized protein JCM6883_007433 [Sporobolomyces salmoneus]|uniref:uncharacterized protein n=1 Tax=Sporobolomyces salmoneus TaxID=183962 RepID=UPI0031782B44
MNSLSSLPPELLRDIIESTVPHTYHSTTYRQQQFTLRSLSLVSRQFRAIAQPLLLEIVCIQSDDQLKFLLEMRDTYAECKELILGPDASSEMIEGFLTRWKGFSSLAIERPSMDPFDLAVLVRHTTLVNLQLSGFGFDFTVRSTFTTLRSFTFDFPAMYSSVPLLLDPEVLPSLQALGLKSVTDEEELQRLGETNLSRLLPQLDVIAIHSSLYRLGIHDLFSGYSSRILVDVYHWTFDSPDHTRFLASVQHIRIKGSTTAANLALLALCQESENSSLESIYLPPEWRPSRVQSADIRTEMERIIEDCENAGIELVFDLEPKSYLGSYISREFWDRQRRSRDKE